MYTKKLNLTINLPGRIMLSEEECLKKVRRPLLDNKGNQKYNKNGEPIYKTVLEPDYAKTERTIISVFDRQKQERNEYSIYTRKCKPAQQMVSVSLECYKNYIDPKIVPLRYRGTKPMWAKMSDTERLEWNLKELAEALGGTMDSYYILK